MIRSTPLWTKAKGILSAGADAHHQQKSWAIPKIPAPKPIPTARRSPPLKLDDESTEKLLKECDRLARMQSTPPKSGVIRSYLDTCLGLPWHITTEDDLDQAHARRVLDREHYGLQKVKERILELLAVRKLTHRGQGPNRLPRRPSGRRQDQYRPFHCGLYGPASSPA